MSIQYCNQAAAQYRPPDPEQVWLALCRHVMCISIKLQRERHTHMMDRTLHFYWNHQVTVQFWQGWLYLWHLCCAANTFDLTIHRSDDFLLVRKCMKCEASIENCSFTHSPPPPPFCAGKHYLQNKRWKSQILIIPNNPKSKFIS